MKAKKVILITGAARGFGLEMVKAAIKNGDRVVATVRSNKEELYALFENHPDLLVLEMDVTDELQIQNVVKTVLERFSVIDVLINNAGYGILTAVEEASANEVRSQYETNVFGVLNLIRAVLPSMRARRKGHIINVSSLFAFDVGPGWGVYASTKGAIEVLSKGLARELKPLGIKVTAMAPGLFSTNFLGENAYRKSTTVIPDYADTVGLMRESMADRNGRQPGDPRKLAELAIKIAHEVKPPLHFLVGPDAIDMLRRSEMGINADVEHYMGWSISTDHS